VNPMNMKIGNHVDWAAGFPFGAVGLADNYSISPPAIYAFGFEFDTVFLAATRGGWKGIDLAVEQLEKQAAAEQMPIARYRAMLQRRYKDIEAAAAEMRAAEGGSQ